MERVRKMMGSLFVAAAFAAAHAAPTNAAVEDGLLEFDDFECPGPCPAGADPCCMKLPPICIPGPCPEIE